MSQHFFKTNFNGDAVWCMLGWDRPLQGFFCLVSLVDDSQFDGEGTLYSNLDDPQLEHSNGFSPEIGYFRKVLEGMDISLPTPMLDAIQVDAVVDRGNRGVVWNASGEIVSDDPL